MDIVGGCFSCLFLPIHYNNLELKSRGEEFRKFLELRSEVVKKIILLNLVIPRVCHQLV